MKLSGDEKLVWAAAYAHKFNQRNTIAGAGNNLHDLRVTAQNASAAAEEAVLGLRMAAEAIPARDVHHAERFIWLTQMVGVRPTVVCLCGSTRFKDEFVAQNERLTVAGEIVLTVGMFGHADDKIDWDTAEGQELKEALDELHKRKIDLADYVFVINPGGYVGESTRSEIAYALWRKKPVEYLETP